MVVETQVAEKIVLKEQFSKDWVVLLYDDDTTDIKVVWAILEEVFKFSEENAKALADKAQSEGKTVVGKYPEKLAKARVKTAMDFAYILGMEDFKMEAKEDDSY